MTKITLILAQAPGRPDGDIAERLTLELDLTQQGHIDLSRYETAPSPWLAIHEKDGQAPRPLEIIRLDEGWALQPTDSLDDPIWVFDGGLLRPGELVRVRAPGGDPYLFRVVATEACRPDLESEAA